MIAFLATIAGYAVGTIPFGILVARAAGGADPRRTGSGSTGATNVGRAAGPWAGLLTAILDAGKGAAIVIVADRLGGPEAAACAAAGAVAGHAWPPWSWRGAGKGVATAAGGLAALAPIPALVAIGIFAAMLALGRRMSLASLVAAVSFPVAALLLRSSRPVLAAGLVIAGVIVVRHRENVVRLLAGVEPTIGGG